MSNHAMNIYSVICALLFSGSESRCYNAGESSILILSLRKLLLYTPAGLDDTLIQPESGQLNSKEDLALHIADRSLPKPSYK